VVTPAYADPACRRDRRIDIVRRRRRYHDGGVLTVLAFINQVSVIVFMVGSLAGVGLGLTLRDVLAPLRHGQFVVRSLLASWIVCPATAWILLQVRPLDSSYAAGLLMLSLAPCAPFAPAMAARAGGDAAYMAAFTMLSAVTTIVVMPLFVPIFVSGLSADPLSIARPLVLFVLAPLAAGMLVRQISVAAADRARAPVAAATSAAALGLVVMVVILHSPGVIVAFGSFAVATEVVFVAAITLLAHACGSGLAHEQRSVLTLGASTRNLGAALAPLVAADADPRSILMIVIAVPVTIAASALTAKWLRRNQTVPAAGEPASSSATRGLAASVRASARNSSAFSGGASKVEPDAADTRSDVTP
jgi:BASS family bile acid:Na+ symporter